MCYEKVKGDFELVLGSVKDEKGASGDAKVMKQRKVVGNWSRKDCCEGVDLRKGGRDWEQVA